MATPEEITMVRLLTADTTEGAYLISDEQLGALLTLEGGNARLAAAAALEVVATSHVLLAKKITTQDLSIDGPAVADALRKSASGLRALAQKEKDDADGEVAADDSFGFDYVDFQPHPRAFPTVGWS